MDISYDANYIYILQIAHPNVSVFWCLFPPRRVQENPALAQTLLALAEKLVDLEPTAALASNEEDAICSKADDIIHGEEKEAKKSLFLFCVDCEFYFGNPQQPPFWTTISQKGRCLAVRSCCTVSRSTNSRQLGLQDKRMIVDAVSDAVGVPQFALAVQSSLFDILRQAGFKVTPVQLQGER